MNDSEKIKLLKRIFFDDIDLMESYRKTYSVPFGHGLGLTGSEAKACFVRRILKGEPVTIIEYDHEENLRRIQRYKDWLMEGVERQAPA